MVRGILGYQSSKQIVQGNIVHLNVVRLGASRLAQVEWKTFSIPKSNYKSSASFQHIIT